jgi:magnesium chelatase subunit H
MALLKRLRGSSKKPGEQSSGAKQMAMLKRLPKILRFIPGTAQDVRAYFLTLQYWLSGSDENVANMVRFLVSRYADGPRENLRTSVKADMPADYPEVGIYHPDLPTRVTDGLLACRHRQRHAARWGSSSCAPTCWPATLPIMTGS